MDSSGSNTRQGRRQSRLRLETLEGRALLSVAASAVQSSSGTLTVTSPVQTFKYALSDGAHVTLQVVGIGNLEGTTVDADGALNLRYSGTNELSGIIGTIVGGGGQAPLASVQSLTLPQGSLTGVGGSLINVMQLTGFNLLAGGRINMTSGMHILDLNSAANNTQISLRELPETAGSPVFNTPKVGAGVSDPAGTSVSAASSSNSSTLILQGETGLAGQGGTVSSTAATTATTTVVTFPTSATLNGQTLSFSYPTTGSNSGGQILSGVSGTFVPGTNVVEENITYGSSNPQPGAAPAPPGVKIQINQISGPASSSTQLGPAQIFGFDATQNALIRFNTGNGEPTLTIPNALPNPNVEAGVALATVGGTQVVLISDGTNVYAYNANNGASVGQFSLAALKTSTGLVNPTRIGTAGLDTVVGDPTGGANGLGLLEPIDVAASLASGQATALGATTGSPAQPYSLTRAFGLTGGLTGVAGVDTLYAAGGGHFDSYQPNQFQLGIASLSLSGTSLSESSRSVLSGSLTTATPTTARGAALTGASLNNALGSIGPNLALDTGLSTTPSGAQVNTLALYSPTGLTQVGAAYLLDSNPLTSLSGSFYPTLANAALIDVQGNTQSLKAQEAQGLVFSGEGNVNLVQIKRTTDTTIVGYPFGHAIMPHRNNVTIVSSTRTVGARNGVTELPGLTPTGPLSLPTS